MSTPSPATTVIAMPTVPTATAAVAASTIAAPETVQSQYDCDNVPDVFSGAVKGAKLYQEDSFATIATPSNRTRIGAVFDGHGGYNGLLASQTARDYCRHYFISRIGAIDDWSVAEWQNELIRLFAETHAAIRHKFMHDTSSNAHAANGSNNSASAGNGRFLDEKGIVRAANGDPIHGGSTATVVVMKVIDDTHATIITANVGDSTAILMPASSGYEFLSVDHGPENDDEFERVHTLPTNTHPLKLLFVYDKTTVFRKYECPLVFTDDGTKDNAYVSNPWAHGLHPTNVRYEPAVYAVTPKTVTKDSTCIAMTRALGDFYAHQFGLSWVPSITVRHIAIDERDTAFTVCVASDGIWDCWKYEDFHSFVNGIIDKSSSQQAQTQSATATSTSTSTSGDANGSMGDSANVTNGGTSRSPPLSLSGRTALDESVERAINNFGSKHFDDACLILWRFTKQ